MPQYPGVDSWHFRKCTKLAIEKIHHHWIQVLSSDISASHRVPTLKRVTVVFDGLHWAVGDTYGKPQLCHSNKNQNRISRFLIFAQDLFVRSNLIISEEFGTCIRRNFIKDYFTIKAFQQWEVYNSGIRCELNEIFPWKHWRNFCLTSFLQYWELLLL